MIIDLDSWKKNHEDTLGTGEFFAKESSNNGGSFGSLLVRVQVQEREMGGGGYEAVTYKYERIRWRSEKGWGGGRSMSDAILRVETVPQM